MTSSLLIQMEDFAAEEIKKSPFFADCLARIFTYHRRHAFRLPYEQIDFGVAVGPACLTLDDRTKKILDSGVYVQFAVLTFVRPETTRLGAPEAACLWTAEAAEAVLRALQGVAHAIGGGGEIKADRLAIQPLTNFGAQVEYLHAGSTPAFYARALTPKVGTFVSAHLAFFWTTISLE